MDLLVWAHLCYTLVGLRFLFGLLTRASPLWAPSNILFLLQIFKFANLSLRKNFQIFIKRKNMAYSSLIFLGNLDHSRRLKHALTTFAFVVEISWPKVEPCVFSDSKHQKHFLFHFLICYANHSALLVLVQISHTRPSTFYISTSEVWMYYLRHARSVRALLENYSRGHQVIILLNFKDKRVKVFDVLIKR